MNKQKGSVHVLLIIGLIVVLAGSIGYNFWQHFNSSEKDRNTQETTTQITAKDDEKPADSFKGVYTSGGNFQVKIPNGWTASVGPYEGFEMKNSHLVLLAGPNELENLKYVEREDPVISAVPGFGWDGLTEHFYILSQENQPIDSPDFITSSFKLSDGSTGKKYTRSFTKDTQTEFSMFTKDADSYIAEIYEVKKGDTSVRAYLNRYSNSSFDTVLGKKVIMSIKIN